MRQCKLGTHYPGKKWEIFKCRVGGVRELAQNNKMRVMKKREDAHYRKMKEGRQDNIQNQETRNCFSLLPTDFLRPPLPWTAAFLSLLFTSHKLATLFHQFQTLICLFLYNSMPSYAKNYWRWFIFRATRKTRLSIYLQLLYNAFLNKA